jgi:Trehalose utilisation
MPILAAGGILVALVTAVLPGKESPSTGASAKPLKALLITGGCCHDYATQKQLLSAGLSQRIPIEWTIVHEGGSTLDHKVSVYSQPDWSKGYDVVVHDECFANVKDVEFVKGIVKGHEATPGINLHCAMHCYRVGEFSKPVTPGSGDALWFDYIGLQSSGHGPQEPIAIDFTEKTHAANQGQVNWTTIKEELYNNISILPGTTSLAVGSQDVNKKQKQPDGTETIEKKTVKSTVAWASHYGPNKTPVWSTTIGHNNDTVSDDRYLDMVAQGILWATGKLDDKGQPQAGYSLKRATK